MAANHKGPHFPNVRERRAARLAREAEAPKPTKPTKAKKAKVEAKDGAQSEPQASDSAESVAETDTQGFEKPMTLGSVNG